MSGVGLGDEDFFVGEGEGVGGYLAEDGVGALAELGGGDEEAGSPFGGDVDGDFGGQAALAGAGEACSVEEGGEAYAAFDGAGGVFFFELGALGVVIGLFEGSGEERLHVYGVGEELACGRAVAGGEEVAAAELFWGEAYNFGDLVHVALEGEDALRGAEAAEGSVGRDVGGHRFGADGEVRPVVGAGGVDRSAGEDDGGEGCVGPAVDGEVDLAGEEFAVFADGGAVAGAGGVALGGCGHVLGAVVADFYGVAGLHGEQGGVAADDGGEVFFAAEGSAGFGLDDAAFFGWKVEHEGEGVDEVEGALHGAADRDSGFGIVFGYDSVIFDVELLLCSGAVLAFDDEVGLLPDLVGDGLPVLLHQVGFEGVVFAPDDLFLLLGFFDGVDGGQHFVGDVDGGYGGGEGGFVWVGEEEDGFGVVVDVSGGEAGVVFGEVDNGVLAGDVGGGDDGVFVPGEGWVEFDGGDAAAWDGAADGGSVPHAGEGDVVDVLGAAQNFSRALFA